MKDDTPQDPRLVENLLGVITGLVPLLASVKLSIEESSGHIPKASNQLTSVTKATESATVEILNVLDAMTRKMERAESGLAHLKELLARRRVLDAQVGECLNGLSATSGSTPAFEALRTAWEESQRESPEGDPFASIETSLGESKMDSMNIAMALQVQDITSQQIAGVVHTIETVRQKLLDVLDTVNGTATALPGGGEPTEPSHFDREAQFTRSTERQETADQIVQQWNTAHQ
jgi:hypothetical protein